jgi:predicted ATPase/DNA-binding SARP family transcriptional activator/Tfp pilus assembly protein PilF
VVQWSIETEETQSSPSLWQITLFGNLLAHRNGQAMERFPTQKTASLFALLAYDPHRRHTREMLATTLWPDADPAAARDRLSQALTWLRPRLEPEGIVRGDVLITDRLSVALNPERLQTDVGAFRASLEAARKAETPSLKSAVLTQALQFYTGDLLPDDYTDWVLTERRHLHEFYLSALRELQALREAAGDLEQALELARRVLAADTLQEEAHQELIRLLAATGRTAAALLQFRELKRLLAAELGVEPSPATQALVERLQQQAPLPQPTLPLPESIRPTPIALPRPLARFFGRDVECAHIAALIHTEGARLVTLTGTGGAGKTRLSLTVAARLTEAFAGAIVFVPLADLDNIRLAPAAIAAALRLTGTSTRLPLEQVVEALSQRPYLLVLDNLEHLALDSVPLVRELLERVPTLSLLVTSRQRLGLEGEQEVSVPSLPLPLPDAPLEQILAAPSIQLFADRARSVRPDFEITAANAATVARLCALLDGIPLAIELCAAWAQTLTPTQMLESLDRRFDLLVSRRTDITPRHRTLRAALEYSYLQLPEPLQQLFLRLSVFRGGWSLEAAGAVCYEEAPDHLALLAALTELRERSLILAEPIRTERNDGTMRYRLLDTLREYASELLSYADRTARRRAHALYFLCLAEQLEPRLTSPDPERWLNEMQREGENLHTALTWCLANREVEMGLRLGGAMGQYWAQRGPLHEGEHWLRQLLDLTEATETPVLPAAAVQAKAGNALGNLLWSQGKYDEARVAHERALVLRRAAEDRSGIAESLYNLGITAYRQEDFIAARTFLVESRTIAEAQGDRAGVARVLLNLGNLAFDQKHRTEARALYQQSITLERELGNKQRVAKALNNLGLLALGEGDQEEAATIFTEALAIYRELTDDYGTTTALANLGTVARLLGQPEHARSLINEGLRLAQALGDRFITVHHLLQLGILDAQEGAPARGVLLLSHARYLFEKMVGSRRIIGADGYREALNTARLALGAPTFRVFWSRGQSESLTSIVAAALAPLPSWEQNLEKKSDTGSRSA